MDRLSQTFGEKFIYTGKRPMMGNSSSNNFYKNVESAVGITKRKNVYMNYNDNLDLD